MSANSMVEKNIWDLISPIEAKTTKSKRQAQKGVRKSSSVKSNIPEKDTRVRKSKSSISKVCLTGVVFNLDAIKSKIVVGLSPAADNQLPATQLPVVKINLPLPSSHYQNVFGVRDSVATFNSPFLSSTMCEVVDSVAQSCLCSGVVNDSAQALILRLEQSNTVHDAIGISDSNIDDEEDKNVCHTVVLKRKCRVPEELITNEAFRCPTSSEDRRIQSSGHHKIRKYNTARVRTVADLKRIRLMDLNDQAYFDNLGLRKKTTVLLSDSSSTYVSLMAPNLTEATTNPNQVWIGNQLQDRYKVSRQVLGLKSSAGYIADRSLVGEMSRRDRRKIESKLLSYAMSRKRRTDAPGIYKMTSQFDLQGKRPVGGAFKLKKRRKATFRFGMRNKKRSVYPQNSPDRSIFSVFRSEFLFDDNSNDSDVESLNSLLPIFENRLVNPMELVDKISRMQHTLVRVSGKPLADTKPLLHQCCNFGNVEGAFYLLLYGANANQRFGVPAEGPLHLAARRGDNEMIRLLLRFRANPALLNSDGQMAEEVASSAHISDYLRECRLRYSSYYDFENTPKTDDSTVSSDHLFDMDDASSLEGVRVPRLSASDSLEEPSSIVFDVAPNSKRLPPCATLTRTESTSFVFNECMASSSCYQMSVILFDDLVQAIDLVANKTAKQLGSKLKESLSASPTNLPFIRRLSSSHISRGLQSTETRIVPFNNAVQKIFNCKRFTVSTTQRLSSSSGPTYR